MSDQPQVTNCCPICVELTAKLEAAESKAQKAINRFADMNEERYALKTKLEAAEKKIANAPHTTYCRSNLDDDAYGGPLKCDCWKSQRSEGDEN